MEAPTINLFRSASSGGMICASGTELEAASSAAVAGERREATNAATGSSASCRRVTNLDGSATAFAVSGPPAWVRIACTMLSLIVRVSTVPLSRVRIGPVMLRLTVSVAMVASIQMRPGTSGRWSMETAYSPGGVPMLPGSSVQQFRVTLLKSPRSTMSPPETNRPSNTRSAPDAPRSTHSTDGGAGGDGGDVSGAPSRISGRWRMPAWIVRVEKSIASGTLSRVSESLMRMVPTGGGIGIGTPAGRVVIGAGVADGAAPSTRRSYGPAPISDAKPKYDSTVATETGSEALTRARPIGANTSRLCAGTSVSVASYTANDVG